jgi:O-methyltransferase domain
LHQGIPEIQGRYEVVSGSFFESVPKGADAYLMKHIIHDWDDERCITILKNCHDAIIDNGKLLVIETVIPGANEPSIGKFLDIEMLLMTSGGRERTAKEFQELFAKGGFELTNIIPTPSPISIIEGIKK